MRKIVFEQPLNERMRLFLRLDCLLRQAHYTRNRPSVWDSRATVATILDILSFFARLDIKGEVTKELERHAATLDRLKSAAGIDGVRLLEILDTLKQRLSELYAISGQIGQRLRQNEFLTNIGNRSGIPGGTCEFDLPAYHHWLQNPFETRAQDLRRWLEEFTPIQQAVDLILTLTRQSAAPSREVAQNGFFQKNLDPNAPWQLVYVTVPDDTPYYPEISGGKHRFTVRFMQPKGEERAVQAQDDVEFELGCCMI